MLRKKTNAAPNFGADELKGFSRTIAEIEWLLIILVLLYQAAQNVDHSHANAIYIGLGLFTAFVIGFRFFDVSHREARWKLAIETWAMILFITWVIYYTGKSDSPLADLYMLTIVSSALTLSKLATLLEVALIAACYVFLGNQISSVEMWTLAYFSDMMTRFAPLLLVAYVTTMLAADIHNALARMRSLSEIDELTGIYNVRAFSAILDRTHKQSARYKTVYSILMVDSDSLKPTNDTYGHQVGDQLLQAIVHQMQLALRQTDVIARYGGDEFIALLPHTDTEGATLVAERIRTMIESSPLAAQGKQVKTTVSIGVASFPRHGSESATIMDRADKALYRSKKDGRNRTTTYDVGLLDATA